MAFSAERKESARSKVLVVEDEPSLRFIISDVLTQDHDLVVVEASSADEALELLSAETDIGCVFTDVRMPGSMDGLALSRRILKERPDIKVLITSGHLPSNPAVGDAPFVAKPYDLETVANLIEQLVRSFRSGGALS